MQIPPTDHTIESPEEGQRKVRLFVSDLISSTMGSQELDSWLADAIYEKIRADSAEYLPDSEDGLDAKVALEGALWTGPGPFAGAVYLRRNQSVLLIAVRAKEEINVIRAAGVHPDREDALRAVRAAAELGAPCTSAVVAYIPNTSNSQSDLWVEPYAEPGIDTAVTREFAFGLLIATITQSSARDLQRMPGPSDLANPCDLCTARRIASSCNISFPSVRDNFSLKAWVGTAAHEKLERDLPQVYPHARQEITVRIAEIDGLGVIKGHIDLDLPKRLSMCDFKTTDMKKLRAIRTTSVPLSHFGQTMLYMLGLERSGNARKYATLAYIPRDSSKRSDIWVASCSYRKDVAVGLLNRTKDLVSRLRAGDVEAFESDATCFVCHVQPRLRG